MVEDSFLRVSYDGNLQIIEFDNPKKKNALTVNTYDALSDALAEGAKNDNVKMTVVTGRGNFYSSGNLFSMQSAKGSDNPVTVEEAIMRTKAAIDELIDYPKVLVAVVNGPAIGVACTTLTLFDAVYAVETAWFQTPFANWGITAEGCSSYLFPAIMGPAKAGKMLYFSEKMTASEALKCNFITGVYKQMESGLVWSKLHSCTAFPLGSWIGTKKLLRDNLREKLHEINAKEVEMLKERFNSDDFMDAMMNFMSKSKSKI